MTRRSTASLLPTADRCTLDSVIRSHDYYRLDVMVQELKERGIKISRSALNRYVQDLSKLDIANSQDGKRTIVVIVDLRTGITKTVFSSASSKQILAALASHNPPLSILS